MICRLVYGQAIFGFQRCSSSSAAASAASRRFPTCLYPSPQPVAVARQDGVPLLGAVSIALALFVTVRTGGRRCTVLRSPLSYPHCKCAVQYCVQSTSEHPPAHPM